MKPVDEPGRSERPRYVAGVLVSFGGVFVAVGCCALTLFLPGRRRTFAPLLTFSFDHPIFIVMSGFVVVGLVMVAVGWRRG